MPRTVTFATAVVLTLWCAVCTPMADAWATPLERLEFEGADQRLISGGLIRGDHIQGYLAKPEGAGPFPAVIGLHGCAGMPDTTKRKLVDELVGSGYVVLLVDSFATRGVEHACTGGYSDIAGMRRSDAYGALAFLARQTFVDPQRVAAVGFSQPICKLAMGRLVMPTLILIGALDESTPAADCSDKIDAWGTDGPPIELVVYPGVHHSFFYPELQPGRKIFGHWLEYNEEAATDATRRMREFLKRHLN